MKFLADPLFWLWLAVIAAAGCLAFKRRRILAGALLGCALATSACEFLQVPARLLASLERPYLLPQDGAAKIPAADAVIVLGGYLERFPHAYSGTELSEAADRVITGIELIRDGKAPVLVLGGGGAGDPPEPVEAQTAAAWMKAWGVVSAPVEFLGVSADTHGEAIHAAKLARERGWNRVILVTSAWHMKRAEAAFRNAGLDVITVGSDFQGTAALMPGHQRSLVPRTQDLNHLRLWAEETLGYLYYRLRSWA